MVQIFTYHIAGNFHQGEIFAYFITKLEWQKIKEWKFCVFKLNPLVVLHYTHVFCEHCQGQVSLAAMALLHYMVVLPWRNTELPDPAGPLSSLLPLMAIEQANMAITHSQVLRQWKRPTHQNMYLIATNASLSLHTCGVPPPQCIDHNVYKVLKFFLAKIWECAKINPAKIYHSVAVMDLAKFFPGKNFPLYDILTHANWAKIRTYENFFLRLQHYPILSCTATFCVLRHSKCPCKYGSRISWPWWWKKHAPRVKQFELAQRVSQGVWLEGPGKIQKLELQNFNPMENLKLYENMHQRKFPAIW